MYIKFTEVNVTTNTILPFMRDAYELYKMKSSIADFGATVRYIQVKMRSQVLYSVTRISKLYTFVSKIRSDYIYDLEQKNDLESK